MTRQIAIVLNALLICALHFDARVRAVLDTPNLAGMWVLNPELSEKAPAPPTGGPEGPDGGAGRGRFGGGPSGGPGGGFGGRGGMPPGGFGDGSRPNPEQMKKIRALMEELLQPPARLTIVQDSSVSVTFIDGDGHTRRYSTLGKKEQHQMTSGTVDVRTSWDVQGLRQEITVDRLKVIETFSLNPERRQLIVTVTTDDGRDSQLSTRRVYDALSDR
jgi:hypothetical protein